MKDFDRLMKLGSFQTRFSPTFIILMTLFMDAIGFGIIIPLLPFYTEAFNAGPAALGILVASFSIMQFMFAPIIGRLSDNIGRKPVLLFSILISTASYLLFIFASSFIVLLLSRIVAGIATETAVAQAYIADVTDKNDRASGMGKVNAAHGAGFIIGPAIGGFLGVYGFAVPGIVAAVFTLINLLFVLFLLPESNRSQEGKINYANSESYLKRFSTALKKPVLGSVLVVLFIVFFAFSAVPVIVPLLGMTYFSMGPIEMAYLFIYIGVVQILLQGFAFGKLVARFGEETLILVGPLLMLLGIFLMPLIPNFFIFLLSLTMLASGSGIMRSAIPSFISKMTPSNEQGGILGIASSVVSIATVPGPLIGGFLYGVVGVSTPFFVSATILLFGFLFAIRVIWKYRKLNL